jgi:hypothetical protein
MKGETVIATAWYVASMDVDPGNYKRVGCLIGYHRRTTWYKSVTIKELLI